MDHEFALVLYRALMMVVKYLAKRYGFRPYKAGPPETDN